MKESSTKNAPKETRTMTQTPDRPRTEVTLQALPGFQKSLVLAMAEARPELLRKLHTEGRLQKHLESEEQRFMALALDQKQGGMSDVEAEEIALRKVMPDLDPEFNPDEISSPISEALLAEILSSMNPS